MSILIEGMKMPASCQECCIYDNEYVRCGITGTEPWRGHEDEDPIPIPENCPLKEVSCKACKYFRESYWYCEAWDNSPGFPAVEEDGYCNMFEMGECR